MFVFVEGEIGRLLANLPAQNIRLDADGENCVYLTVDTRQQSPPNALA
jgi:hypothetical protein